MTQWRMIVLANGMVYQGLDYASVWSVIAAQKAKHPGRIFRQIQYLETGALSEING